MRDDVDLRAGRRRPRATSRRAAVLGVHDDRVDALVAARRCASRCPRVRLARQHVVGGEHERDARAAAAAGRAAGRVSHWKWTTSAARARAAAVAQHVGEVLRQAGRLPRATARRLRAARVERLLDAR